MFDPFQIGGKGLTAIAGSNPECLDFEIKYDLSEMNVEYLRYTFYIYIINYPIRGFSDYFLFLISS
jgi:hypothetical protein